MKVALFDYGAGNLHSLAKGLEAGGARVSVTTDWDEALVHEALILPGVGSFQAATRGLADRADRVRKALEDGLPCLGICLGMQVLFTDSEEGGGRGIGFVPGRVRRLRSRTIPQMGWNDVLPDPERGADPLFRALLPSAEPVGTGETAETAGRGGPAATGGTRRPTNARTPADAETSTLPGGGGAAGGSLVCYYANSYVCEPDDRGVVTAWSEYEGDRFAAAVRRGRTWGVQFHPEKSSTSGLRLLRSFLEAARTDRPGTEGAEAGSPTGGAR